MKRNIVIGVVIVLVLLVLGYKSGKMNFKLPIFGSKTLTQDQAKAKVTDFITKNLVQEGTKVEVKSITEENGLYKLSLSVAGQDINSYMTKDGKIFFPEAMPMDVTANNDTNNSDQNNTSAEAPKSDKPDVELFVMSYCPYGTQIEKGILPVIETLGNKINFTLKFVDYAMHDKKELDENMRQYCIQKDQPEKFQKYLSCFLQKGQGTETSCMQSAGVDAAKVSSCVAATDTQFKVTEQYNDKSTWASGSFPPFNVNKDDNDKYGVKGSPTLVVNGTTISAGRDSKSLLSSICSAFNNQPEECQKDLSSTAPAPGFGEGAGSNSTANCGTK